MENQPAPGHSQNQESQLARKRLTEYLGFFAVAMPAFGTLLCIGYALLFLMGLLAHQQPPYALLVSAAGTLVALLLAVPTRKMLKQGQTSRAIFLYAVGFGVFFLLLSMAWQGFVVMAVVGVWLPVMLLFALLENRQQLLRLLGISGIFTALVVLFGRFRLMQPSPLSDQASIPAVLLTAFVVVSFVSIAIITSVLKFRTLSARLTATFVAVTLIPAVTTILVLSLQSFQHDQQLIFQGMNASASQKIDRIDQIVSRIERERDTAIVDPRAQVYILGLLTSQPGSLYHSNSLGAIQEYFPARIGESGLYQKVMLLDPNGEVAYATDPALSSYSFAGEPFFQQALLSPYSTTITGSRALGAAAFITARPIRAVGETIGEIVFVADYSQFAGIVENQSGAADGGESYLVAEDFQPLTKTGGAAQVIQSVGVMDAVSGRKSGTGVYRNYAGATVLGAYQWIPALKAALITEQPRLQSLGGTFLLIGNVLIIGLFAVVLSVMAVVFTSKTLTAPIQELAIAAEGVSHGDLAARADAARPDELGKLAQSFNFMAASLEEIINSLEARIDERTKDLKRQALRLRAAAEISRDSARAVSMKELLFRSAELIGERFGFYHVSTYLLDSNREYLVLNASTGEAGKLMLETGYRVRGGEGIVPKVARTGEIQLSNDSSKESASARIPLLPGTRSELGLPLKSYGVLIGVLDVHSDQTNAFSDEDVAALQLMADQLSVAIERTRVLQEAESRLRELESGYRHFTRESWQALMRARNTEMLGYSYQGVDYQRLGQVPAAAREALGRGEQIIVGNPESPAGGKILAVPVRMRGTTVGAVTLKIRDQEVPPETAELAQDISDRLAQSLEASWLLNESRARAERERFVAELSSQLGAAPDFDAILQTAVQQVGKMIGETEVIIQLNGSQAEQNQSRSSNQC